MEAINYGCDFETSLEVSASRLNQLSLALEMTRTGEFNNPCTPENYRLSVIQTIIEGQKHIDALKKSFQDATLQWLKDSNDEKIDEYLKRLAAAKREVEENETLLKSACSTLEVPF